MEPIVLLSLIKKKLFETRKKIVLDDLGNRCLSDSTSWLKERSILKPEEIELLEKSDGWNVADKDYVDFKCSELYGKFIQSSSLPSAPMLPSTSLTVSNTSTNKTVFFCIGEILEDSIVFFSPGLFLKKNWNITEFTLVSDCFDDEISLFMKNINDTTKSSLVSKIKSNGKQQVLFGETKYKVESNKAVLFEIKPRSKTSKISLQITVEML